MRRSPIPFFLLLSSIPALLWAEEAVKPVTGPRPFLGDLVHGKTLYEAHCQSCHGLNGLGTAESPRLADTGRLNAISDESLLDLIRDGGTSRPKKNRHPTVPSELSRLELWDIIGFLRARTVEVGVVLPTVDRFLAVPHTPDQYGLERLNKTTGKSFSAAESRFTVVVGYKTGWGGQPTLLPNNPKILDKLKRNMKVGYVVAVPLPNQERSTEVVLALDPKTLAILDVRAISMDGTSLPELDKQLQRFVGKGDRRLSGQPKATLKATGGGKNFQALEAPLTEAFVRAAEAVTAFEVEERERTWADDDL